MYFEDNDTYIRKSAYGCISKIYKNEAFIRKNILLSFDPLSDHLNDRIRQTVLNATGEVGKTHFETAKDYFDKGLSIEHHVQRNVVIGSSKKMKKNRNRKP
jgi:hypothetical protein